MAMNREKQERKLKFLEENYGDVLIVALKDCAGGRWGLFGQNDRSLTHIGLHARKAHIPELDQLFALGEQIDQLRQELGYSDAFPLHARLLQLRASNHPNSPGEPKLAQLWLNELSACNVE
jgi:hypothetical protein